ncbi:MAG TPA: prepilin-type N-terminal cleavage/methylation domain-containing protein [Burkholderiales bacterium]|nr:prepilin-type N-terminal cleavage/methylation domain-containing protein [Burkholderiales bacterium]
MNNRNQGFTLVEIAIVLVIIGLLLGGILKGQEMITQAKIKNVMADFSGISAAYHGYQDRYRQIPGDDSGANARWSLGIAAPAGTGAAFGNGVILSSYKSSTANEESRLFWLHLRQAGFVSGSGQNQPFNALTGIIGVQTGDASTSGTVGPVLGADAAGTGGFSGLIMCSANMPDKIAIAVDTQMDDGTRATGTVRAQLQAAPNPDVAKNGVAAAATSGDNYIENGTNTYMLCRAL